MPHFKTTLIHNGKTQTVAEWSKELGIKEATIRKRIRQGQKDAECLRQPRPIKITCFDKTQTLRQWADELGADYNTLLWRVRAGWPIRKIFQPSRHKGWGCCVDGVFRTVRELVEMSGLSENTIRSRLRAGRHPLKTYAMTYIRFDFVARWTNEIDDEPPYNPLEDPELQAVIEEQRKQYSAGKAEKFPRRPLI